MATQHVCRFNRYGFCKHGEKCRNLHIDDLCDKSVCDVLSWLLRHPTTCKFYSEYKRCKFNPCAYKHSDELGDIEIMKNENRNLQEQIDKLNSDIKVLSEKEFESQIIIEKLNKIEENFKILREEKDVKIEKLEMEIKDTKFKVSEQDKK